MDEPNAPPPPDAPPPGPTVSITQKAAEAVLKIRATDNIAPEMALRLGVRGGGCSGFSYALGFDKPDPLNDQVFVQHGVTIVVDNMSLQYLVGTELDYLDGLNGTGFKFNNPQVKSTCGCGSSFST